MNTFLAVLALAIFVGAIFYAVYGRVIVSEVETSEATCPNPVLVRGGLGGDGLPYDPCGQQRFSSFAVPVARVGMTPEEKEVRAELEEKDVLKRRAQEVETYNVHLLDCAELAAILKMVRLDDNELTAWFRTISIKDLNLCVSLATKEAQRRIDEAAMEHQKAVEYAKAQGQAAMEAAIRAEYGEHEPTVQALYEQAAAKG